MARISRFVQEMKRRYSNVVDEDLQESRLNVSKFNKAKSSIPEYFEARTQIGKRGTEMKCQGKRWALRTQMHGTGNKGVRGTDRVLLIGQPITKY